MDEEGNVDCRGNVLKEFLEMYPNEFEGGDGNEVPLR
jgi:hypothetical protein